MISQPNVLMVWLQQRPRLLELALLLAGALQVLGFAPFNLYPIPVLTLAFFFLAIYHSTLRQAPWRGWLFGVGLFGAGVSWVYHSIHLFGHAIQPIAALLTLLFVMALSIVYIASQAWLIRRLFARATPWMLVLLFPVTWVLFEWLRGWMLTGFPWLLLGHGQIDTWLSAWAPLGGVYAVSLVTALLAGLLAYALMQPRHAIFALAGAALILLVSWTLGGLSWTEPDGKPIKVSLIQGNIPQEIKWLPEQRQPTLDLYRRLTREHWDSDLIIWPETAVPDYLSMVMDDYLVPLEREARLNHSEILLGIFIYDFNRDGAYNTVIKLGPDPEVYRKRRLVIFGEYIPGRGLLKWMKNYLDIPMSDLLTGSGKPLIHTAQTTLGMSICYEDAYGEEIADALPESGLLVNVSNDAWFGDTLAPHQHLQIARMRAAELERPLLRATNTGVSAVIGRKGEPLAVSPQFQTDVLTETVQPRKGMTPFARFRNHPVVILLFVLLLIAAWIYRKEQSA
jgi:apolipoprotein N-acyltransferase